MLHPVECLFGVNEDMVYAFLVLPLFLTQNSEVEYLFCRASLAAKTSLFFSDDFFLPVVLAC